MKTTIHILIALCIIMLSIFILHHAHKSKSIAPSNIVDSFVINASFIEYNKQGLIKSQIVSTRVTHFQPSNTAVFENPRIIAFDDNRSPWHIRADQGTSNSNATIIVLKGHVHVRELPTKKEAGLTLTTTELTLYPKESRLTTDKAVILTRPGLVIHGTGFKANLKTGKYRLESQSKAIYQTGQ